MEKEKDKNNQKVGNSKNKKRGVLEIENIVIEMKNAFDGLVRRPGWLMEQSVNLKVCP